MRKIKNKKVFIIAEAGVNHNGNINIAKKMIDVAIEAGADAVKFQTFKAENVVSRLAPKAEYQRKSTAKDESQFDMIKKFELDINAHKQLIDYCRKKDIIFLSSPFDIESVELLNRLGLKIFKIPSGEITNLPYLIKIGSLKKKVIMSTGMADLKEIKDALDILTSSGTPKENITVLHCNTEYPTPFEDVNLAAMLTIRDRFNVKVGYSDHTLGIEIPIVATALGASVIEKHFTLDKKMKGPDHKVSLEPSELIAMVKAVRKVEQAIGDGRKKPTKSELQNRKIVRKSLVASRDIPAGKIIERSDIMIKRPGTGIPPEFLYDVLDRRALVDVEKDSLLKWSQFRIPKR